MKHHILIDYASPDLKPPVYIFTSLAEPQWEPVEMEAEKQADGQFRFYKRFDAEEGDYQYKFRLGPGDWWVCDETKPVVDDGNGNRNNLLTIKPAPFAAAQDIRSNVQEPLTKEHTLESPVVKDGSREAMKVPSVGGQGLAHGKISSPPGAESQQTPERETSDPINETGPDDDTDTKESEDSTTDNADEDDSSSSSEDEDAPAAPLLPHEAITSHAAELSHAPLFRHESISLGNNRHDLHSFTAPQAKATEQAVIDPQIPQEADPNDPSLVRFPSGHAAIMELIQRTATKLPPDVTSNHSHRAPLAHPISSSSLSTQSLASVEEEDADKELERIREAEEEEYEREEADGEEVDPLNEGLAPITPPLTDEEPEDADFEPKIREKDIVIQETVIVEVVEQRTILDSLVELVGGRSNALYVSFT
jgi:hypothetical protein